MENLATTREKTYGDFMRPLDLSAVDLNDVQRSDPLVIKFIILCDATRRKERVSHHSEWSQEEEDAYVRDDTVAFSRMRGYSEEEIGEYLEFLAVHQQVEKKYGETVTLDLTCALEEQTGPDEDPIRIPKIRP